MNCLYKVYKQAVDKIKGCMAKRIFGPKSEFLDPKKSVHFTTLTTFWPRPGKVVKKKVPFSKTISVFKQILGEWKKKHSVGQKTLLGPT